MTKRSTLGGGALLACALLFIGLTIVFSNLLRGWRVDLTENGLYTTAPGTRNILENLKEPVNLYFFFTEKAANEFPQIKTYGTRVREFLQELAARSNGKLRLSIIDPLPYSEDEDRASELGVRGAPTNGGEQLYFGLAGTNSTDGRAAIEFFDPSKEEFLEYDVVKLIYQLANPTKPTIGWLSTLPMQPSFDPQSGQMREPNVMYTQAEQLFTVKPVAPNATSIDADVSVLVIVHPKGLSPATQFAIDQFALRGGHVIAFVDPLAESDQAGADPQNPMAAMTANKSSEMATLLKAWGVDFNPREVIGDGERALSVGMRQGEAPVRHLGILGLDQSSFNRNDVVSSGLSSVNVATTGYVKPVKDAKTKFEPLLQTSAQAAPLPLERFQMLFDPASLRDGFKPTGQRYAIGARVTGNIATAFPGGPPAGATPGGTVLKASAKPLNLLVFADTDMLQDYLWVRQQNFFGQRVAQAWAHNGDLVLNAIDNLAGSTDLISVRGRSTFTRPFERVEAIRRSAEERFRATEKQLEQELNSTEEKLASLQTKRNDDSSLILSPEQAQEIERFQAKKLSIRKQLRDVRLGLNQDIDRLGKTLLILNVVLVPALLSIGALALYLMRRRRRSTVVAAGKEAGA
jgi:ABC-type uncharacterized transport system involved in gliding motility auxiliary subunit